MIERLGPAGIEAMRRAGRAAAEVLQELGEHIQPGITTADIDWLAQESMRRRNLRSSQYGYDGFAGHVCVSPNEVVCHGVPGTRVLRDGDIVNIDVTTELGGYHGDTSRTFLVGDVDPASKRLVQTSYEAMWAGISVVRDGARIGDIGAEIERVASAYALSVVSDYCGHGIGREMHQEPQIPHVGKRGRGRRLHAGMVFTIEPMLNSGGAECKVATDGWTVVTADGARSAQFEHTVLVTSRGAEVLTPWPESQLEFPKAS